jgi:SGNH hydrolase-like domain, acetyltransferase AlgX
MLFGKFNYDPKNYDLELMQKILRGFLEAESIPYVDLLPRFRETGKQESLYLLRDTHWNDAGNRLAATILQERLLPVVETFFESGGKSSIR